MTTINRNKDAGLPGNGGQFAPSARTEAGIGLAPSEESPELSALRGEIIRADVDRDIVTEAFYRASARTIDRLISERFPTAVTARFFRDYGGDDEFILEDLCDAEGDSLMPADANDDVRQINRIAENLGSNADAYLGEEADSLFGIATEFTVGTLGATPSPRVAVIDLDTPDLSGLTDIQLHNLQAAIAKETGQVNPIVDSAEAEYRLYDALEEEPTESNNELAARVATLEAKFGSREALSKAVAGTAAWSTLEGVMSEALEDPRRGARAAIVRAITDLEGRA